MLGQLLTSAHTQNALVLHLVIECQLGRLIGCHLLLYVMQASCCELGHECISTAHNLQATLICRNWALALKIATSTCPVAIGIPAVLGTHASWCLVAI